MKPIDIYHGTIVDYYDKSASNLLDRWQPTTDWLNARARAGFEPYSKSTMSRTATRLRARDRVGREFEGINLASQDYLSLSSHPKVLAAVESALEVYGVHSAGSAALMGLTDEALRLEQRIASFVGVDDSTVFPTGWGAGFGAIRALVRETDHVVIDVLAHACLQEGAQVSTRNVHRYPHCSNEGVRRRLERIRNEDAGCGILVVTESVFSMDSDVPQLGELQEICRDYGATLFVDVAHDLGAIGPTGRGYMEIQGMLGKLDIVMGSFSKTFASNGGFVASNHPALKLALRYSCGPLTFTNAISPLQAAIVLQCFDIVESAEGGQRRAQLMKNILALRGGLISQGFDVLGEPSAIVPVVLGDNAVSRQMTAHTLKAGGIVNLVEYPAVARNACRWRCQVMADHTMLDIEEFVAIASSARDDVRLADAAVSA